MADYAVSTSLRLRDGITNKLKGMAVAASKYGDKQSAAFKKANTAGLTFKKTLGAILSAQVIGRGVALLNRGIRSVATEFVDFDDAIVSAGAKFPQMAKRGTVQFEKLRKVARKVGAETKFSATEAAAGLDFLAMAGFNAEQAMSALPQVTNMAVVANTDLGRATDIASDALGAFNLMSKDSAQLTQNLTRINDVFAKTVTSANTDIEMMFEAMKDGGPVATAAGASIETFSALVGKMADAGIKGSKAGTTVKNMFLQLQAPVPKAKKVIKDLGLELIDNEGKLRDIMDILGDFNKKTKDMGLAQRSAAIDTIFGKRAIAGVSVLLAQGSDSLKDYRQSLIDSKGAAKTMADEMGKSLGNRLKTLRSAAIELGFKFIDAFEKKIPGAIDGAIEAVRNFDTKPIIEGVKTAISVFKVLKEIIGPLTPVIWGLVAAKVAYLAITKGIAAVQAVQGFLAMAKAIKGASAAQGILNAVMLANPVGMVVAAIGLLVAAGYMLYQQWDEIKEIWGFFVDETRDGLLAMGRWFSETWAEIKEVTLHVFESVKESFRDLGAGIKNIWNTVVDFFAETWASIGNTIETAWNKIGEFFTGFWADMKTKALAFLNFIPDKIKGAIGKIKGIFGGGKVAVEATGAEAAAGGEGGAGRVPPNRTDVAAQQVQFRGRLDIAGAPPGSKIESQTTGAPPIQTELLGANI